MILIFAFALLAVIFFHGQGDAMIFALRRVPESRRGRYNAKTLGRFMGTVSLLIAFGLVLIALGQPTEHPEYIGVGTAIAVLSAFSVFFVPIGWFRRR